MGRLKKAIAEVLLELTKSDISVHESNLEVLETRFMGMVGIDLERSKIIADRIEVISEKLSIAKFRKTTLEYMC